MSRHATSARSDPSTRALILALLLVTALVILGQRSFGNFAAALAPSSFGNFARARAAGSLGSFSDVVTQSSFRNFGRAVEEAAGAPGSFCHFDQAWGYDHQPRPDATPAVLLIGQAGFVRYFSVAPADAVFVPVIPFDSS